MRLSVLPDSGMVRSVRRFFIALGREPYRLQGEGVDVRWWQDGTARGAVEEMVREYVLAFLLRNGGGLRHVFFPSPRQRWAGYVWEEPIRSHFHLPLSGKCLELLVELQRLLGGGDEEEREEALHRLEALRPETNGDLLFFHALVRQGLRSVWGMMGKRVGVVGFLFSPLSLFTDFDLLPVEEAMLSAASSTLNDPILLPLLGAHLVQRWLEVEGVKETSPLEQVERWNERQVTLWSWLWENWVEGGRVEGLVWFARFFARLWRWGGGFAPLLERVRARARQRRRQEEREAFERSFGELFRFGPLLEEWALYLRGQPWVELTEAEKFFLGEYARLYEGIAREVHSLQRELCHEL